MHFLVALSRLTRGEGRRKRQDASLATKGKRQEARRKFSHKRHKNTKERSVCRGDAPVLTQRYKRQDVRRKFSHERGTTGDSQFNGTGSQVEGGQVEREKKRKQRKRRGRPVVMNPHNELTGLQVIRFQRSCAITGKHTVILPASSNPSCKRRHPNARNAQLLPLSKNSTAQKTACGCNPKP